MGVVVDGIGGRGDGDRETLESVVGVGHCVRGVRDPRYGGFGIHDHCGRVLDVPGSGPIAHVRQYVRPTRRVVRGTGPLRRVGAGSGQLHPATVFVHPPVA